MLATGNVVYGQHLEKAMDGNVVSCQHGAVKKEQAPSPSTSPGPARKSKAAKAATSTKTPSATATATRTKLMIESGFTKRLIHAREVRGLRVRELARLANASPGHITHLEYGDRGVPAMDTVIRVAEALDVTLEWLCVGTGEMQRFEQPIDVFLAEVERRGIRKLLDAHPGRWNVSTVARAMRLQFKTDDETGAPVGGWAKVLDDVQTGKYNLIKGRAADVARATSRQVMRMRRQEK